MVRLEPILTLLCSPLSVALHWIIWPTDARQAMCARAWALYGRARWATRWVRVFGIVHCAESKLHWRQ